MKAGAKFRIKPTVQAKSKRRFLVAAHENFMQYLQKLLCRTGLTQSDVLSSSQLTPECAYSLFTLGNGPNRNTVLRLAIALRQDVQGAQHLLTLSCNKKLCTKLLRDAAIAFCLEKQFDLHKTQSLLRRYQLPPL